MDKSDDVILVLVADRIARLLLLQNRLDALGGCIVKVEADHIGARYHDLTRVQLREREDIIHEVRLCTIDQPLPIALLHQEADLLLRVRVLVLPLHIVAEFAADRIRDGVQNPDKGTHDAAEEHHRECNREHDVLDVRNRHGLWCKLAEHDVQRGDDRKGNRKRNRVPNLVRQPEHMRHGQDERRNRGLTHPAKTKRGECDAELRHRERVVEMLGELLRISGAAAPLRNQRLETRGADLDAAELRRDEEAVHEDQKDNEQYVEQCGQYVHE